MLKIRLSLAYKLFCGFFLILAIVISAMFLSRYIFSQNFRHYIKQVELERLESLVPVLQDLYRQKNSWDDIRKAPSDWGQRLEEEANIHMAPPPFFEESKKNVLQKPSRLLLLDENGLSIIGVPDSGENAKIYPITVDGRVVGWLGMKNQRPFQGPPEELLKRQATHLTLLGVLVISITVVIALIFSRHLLQPVKQLIKGTQALAERKFSVRILPATADELGTLAENFNTMAATLEEYETLRKKWLSDISHELRTPLAVLRGELEAMEDGVRDISPESISSLHSEVLRISKLVEDLHLLSMTESDNLRMEKKTCSPRRTLEDVVSHFESRLEEKKIELQLMLDDLGLVRINADEDRLSQVFFNILDNSCKYIEQGGRLRISGGSKESRCYIRFDDSGPGVSEAALPQLFDRLYREEQSRSRVSGGSGLGLAICHHIIAKHDGQIWAENSSHGGLAVIISLPLINEPSVC